MDANRTLPLWMTPGEASAATGLSCVTLRQMGLDKRIGVLRMPTPSGRPVIRYKAADVRSLVEANYTPAAEGIAGRIGLAPAPMLAQA
jgi:hypothetical protein